MGRIRSVKPEYWTSEQVMSLSRDARLLFIGLWNFSDDGGNHPASAITLKAEVLPGDLITADQVMAWIDEMIEQGLLEEYEADGKTFWHVTGWKHQRIDQPTYRHPKGDTSDTGDAGDTRVTQKGKRLGGKQRQIVLKKLRERDGDACHLCSETSNLSLFSTAHEDAANPHEISLLRLICPSCKRNQSRGDTQKPVGDAGDAKPLDGDSPTEWSGVEGKGGEGIGGECILKPEAAPPASNVVGDTGDASSQIATRVGQICILLRRAGINTSPQNLQSHAWVSNAGATDDLIITAIAKAKQNKPGTTIHPNYLKPIIEELLTPQEAKPSKPPGGDDWFRSNAGIERKGRELGMYARGTESHNDFKDRIFAKLREGGKAA